MEDLFADRDKSPHEQAMDRHEAAVEALAQVQKRAAEMISAAEREAGEALTELIRYEKQPGVPLPVEDQRRIAGLLARARMDNLISGDAQ